MWLVCGIVVALTTRPLVRRGCNPRLGPSAPQMDWPAVLSEQQVGLLRRSFGYARALDSQESPSLPSTLLSHGSTLCRFDRSHSTEAVPAG